VINQDNRYHYG